DGPRLIATANLTADEGKDSRLGKLIQAFVSLFFSDDKEKNDAHLVVRDPMLKRLAPIRVPRLLFPPSECRLRAGPVQLRWEPVDGVHLYTVSIFDNKGLIHQETSSDNYVEIKQQDSLLSPAEKYYWVVEAKVGSGSVSSPERTFRLLDDAETARVDSLIAQQRAAVADERVSRLLAAGIYWESGLKADCYGELEEILDRWPGNYSAGLMKAQLLEDMGFYREASSIYRALIENTRRQ
ncbi:MAG: hypothetical protein JSW34_01655, partial [Candidatus Zixiibacteriota bacterium]